MDLTLKSRYVNIELLNIASEYVMLGCLLCWVIQVGFMILPLVGIDLEHKLGLPFPYSIRLHVRSRVCREYEHKNRSKNAYSYFLLTSTAA